MKSLQVALLCLVCAVKSHGQTTTHQYGQVVVTITKEKRPKKIYAKVETISNFPGGDSAGVKSLENNFNRSITYRNGAPKGAYTVSVVFIVAKDGSLSDVRCLTNPGYGMCEAVMRVMKKAPRWVPADRADGIPVQPYRH